MEEIFQKIMIETKGLSKYYGPFVAIKDVTFAIPEGQIVAFLGPNGAGKTTTMRILSGYLSPSEGQAFIAGLDVSRDRLKIAKRLGYLPENGPLYQDMTPLESLRFFAEVRQLTQEESEKRIEIVTRQAAIQEVLEKPIDKLSKGYRQRVGLAQALLHDPDIMIMDEPTLGLDPNQIREFRKNIKELGKSKTILLSTHILQEVEAVADRVILIHNGRLVFDGTPDELREEGSLEKPFYRLTNEGRANEGQFGEEQSGEGRDDEGRSSKEQQGETDIEGEVTEP